MEEKKAQAKKNLDEWLEVTGVISKESTWYHELVSIVEDAVEIGETK